MLLHLLATSLLVWKHPEEIHVRAWWQWLSSQEGPHNWKCVIISVNGSFWGECCNKSVINNYYCTFQSPTLCIQAVGLIDSPECCWKVEFASLLPPKQVLSWSAGAKHHKWVLFSLGSAYWSCRCCVYLLKWSATTSRTRVWWMLADKSTLLKYSEPQCRGCGTRCIFLSHFFPGRHNSQ